MSEQVMVSVIMTTYNHERYIAHAIESVLRQQTDFRIEIVIGEDCSTDRTRAIAEDYAQQYPEAIRIVTSEENVGWRKNYRRTIAAARGKYIALLDGDDYFTHRKKLQMQVDILEAHPEVGMCYGRSERVDEAGNTAIYPEGECLTTFEAMLRRNPAENCTTMARRELVEQYYKEIRPEEHPEWRTDDLPMWLWFAARSRYVGIDCPMAVHRVLRESVSHNPDYRKKIEFVDSLYDISLFYDNRYNESRMHDELQRSKHNTALWVLSYNGGIGEYLRRWIRDAKAYRPLIKNIASYGLFVKKICWRMWVKQTR
ncbi:MAG: glycosyltransferase [Alistipes sp.]|nr:glycosyltransferase [Alistipes sp.]